MFKVSIKVNILTIFITLLSIVSLSLLYSQYYFSKKVAVASTTKTFNKILKNTYTRLEIENRSLENVLNIVSSLPSLDIPIKLTKPHADLDNIVHLLQLKKQIYSIYFTQKNGSSYQVINMHESKTLLKKLKAPKESRWTVIKRVQDREKYLFYDKNLSILGSYTQRNNFNLQTRPWYQKAINSDSMILSEPYNYASIDAKGITYAKKVKEGTIVALDYTLNGLNKFFKLQLAGNYTDIFALDKNAQIIVSSNPKIKKVDASTLNAVQAKELNKLLKYKEGNTNYYTMILPLIKIKSFLVIKTDADKLFQPYRDSFIYSLEVALSLLFLSLPLVIIATNFIIKPIKALIKENIKIKRREFSKVSRVDTNIIEFSDLSNSLVDMSQSIEVYQKSQEELLNSIIKLIAEAIDAKSPYTGGHCKRVPEIAELLLKEANNATSGVFEKFSFSSKDELREFEIGAWLHDCGKVTTPEYVVDKSTKLETIYNRIHEIRTRFEVLLRDAKIEQLQGKLTKEELQKVENEIKDDFEFIAEVNIGGEFMDESKQHRIKKIADREYLCNLSARVGLGEVEALRYEGLDEEKLPFMQKILSDEKFHIVKRENFDYEAYKREKFTQEVPKYLYNYGEVYNLCIEKGTLSNEERYKINEHVIMTIKMLEKIPFPTHLTNIPEYAGTHHETLIGTGYPRGLTKEQLSIPARVMVIADIFEALTASDRPYKKAKSLSTSIKIMSFMVKDKHIDEDLFKLFLSSGAYKVYAEKYLKPEQIDEVDISLYT